jgi:hypothetical protein
LRTCAPREFVTQCNATRFPLAAAVERLVMEADQQYESILFPETE